MFKIILAILVLSALMIIFHNNSIVAVTATILASVLLWKGLWDIMEFVSTQLKLDDNPLASGVLATTAGLLISYGFSKNVSDMWGAASSHF